MLDSSPVALIEFRNVKKAFGPKRVYRNLNLDVREGESLTIVGGSGQGKSVLLRLLIGLLSLDGGTIRFRGEVISDYEEKRFIEVRRHISMLFQGAALFDSLSVYDNIAYGIREHLAPPEDEVAQRVSQALSNVGLEGVEHMWPSDLSGGMKKRVGLARAIAFQPDVILYDEPTTGLDPINVTRINRLINNLKDTLRVTSVVVTHDMNTAFSVSDRIAMIHEGRVIFEGTPEDVRTTDNRMVRDFVEGNAPHEEDTDTLLRVSG
jgi:phospholipid/cholesterol/gamma-HCH transport system ATP-binding protein